MSDNGGKKSMQHTRLVKCALGAGLVLSFGIFGKYMVSSSTTMGSETELAGMAYMLDQYCTIQVGATQSNPEAIVAFEDMPGNTNNGTSAVSGSAVSNATPEPTKEATATATPKPESEYANVGISIAADYVNIRKKPNTDAEKIRMRKSLVNCTVEVRLRLLRQKGTGYTLSPVRFPVIL